MLLGAFWRGFSWDLGIRVYLDPPHLRFQDFCRISPHKKTLHPKPYDFHGRRLEARIAAGRISGVWFESSVSRGGAALPRKSKIP